jgi:hypothetical protein
MTITLTAAANNAAQQLGVLDSGEGLSTPQITDALFDANNMIESWGVDRLMATGVNVVSVAMVNGTANYAVGLPAPAAIESASILTASGPVMPVKVITGTEWEQIPNREKLSALVQKLFYDRAGFIRLSPVPTGGTLEYTSWTTLALFADATTGLVMSPGYARMVVLSLAMEMAARFDTKPSESLVSRYQEAMNNVRTLNASSFGSSPFAGSSTEAK